MRKKGFILAAILMLLFAGCDTASPAEEWVLPTMDPAVETQEGDAIEQEDDVTEQNSNEEDAAEEEEETLGGMYSDFMSYIDNSKQAVDRNQADAVEIVVEAACIEAQIKGMTFPAEPIRFRYTNELDELDESYSLLKEAILDLMGDDVIELKVEGNYLMVEISQGENGTPEVNVELLQE